MIYLVAFFLASLSAGALIAAAMAHSHLRAERLHMLWLLQDALSPPLIAEEIKRLKRELRG